jgi:hypothetical protein
VSGPSRGTRITFTPSVATVDGIGNITAYFDSTSGQWQNIQYDALNRLVAANGPATFNNNLNNFCWSYDNFGNRTSQYIGSGGFTPSWGSCSGGGSTVTTNTQTYNSSNQLTSASLPVSYFTYDSSGNMTSDGSHNYAYDAEGRLCAVSTMVLSMTSYTGYLYNAEGAHTSNAPVRVSSPQTPPQA